MAFVGSHNARCIFPGWVLVQKQTLMTTLASLFNLAGPDLVIILGIVLLLFGAKKLPELARGMGQAVREFSKAKDEFEREVTRPVPPEPAKHLEQNQGHDAYKQEVAQNHHPLDHDEHGNPIKPTHG
jgi:sec-independent protein translocase protein TatA